MEKLFSMSTLYHPPVESFLMFKRPSSLTCLMLLNISSEVWVFDRSRDVPDIFNMPYEKSKVVLVSDEGGIYCCFKERMYQLSQGPVLDVVKAKPTRVPMEDHFLQAVLAGHRTMATDMSECVYFY